MDFYHPAQNDVLMARDLCFFPWLMFTVSLTSFAKSLPTTVATLMKSNCHTMEDSNGRISGNSQLI